MVIRKLNRGEEPPMDLLLLADDLRIENLIEPDFSDGFIVVS